VGVWTPQGVWTTATGLAEVPTNRPMAFELRSAWRSVTKSLTVTLMLQLVEEGRLDLDAPVSTYYQGVPNGENITLRQLANMTSGLFNYTKDDDFLAEFSADFAKEWTPEELLALSFSHPVNFPAGTDYEYSNTNTVLIGEIVESVTGQSLEDLYAERIFAPLAMSSTNYVTGPNLPEPNARGYFYNETTADFEELVVNSTALGASGAMAGTLEDLHQWGRALTLGTLISPELQAQRFVSRPPTNGPVYDSYGLGIGEVRGWWGHTGAGLGYQAAVFTDPVSGSSVAILMNGTNENQDVPVDLFRNILDSLGR
jgi:D-alanyl-D-alanine carboxypeptidase